MELRHLSGSQNCWPENCPGFRQMGAGNVVIVGTEVTDPAVLAQLGIGLNENAIMCEPHLVIEAAAKLAERQSP